MQRPRAAPTAAVSARLAALLAATLALGACGSGSSSTTTAARRGVAQPAPHARKVRLPRGVLASVGGHAISQAQFARAYQKIVRASHQPAPDAPRYERCTKALAEHLRSQGTRPTRAQLERQCEQRDRAIAAAAMTELILDARKASPGARTPPTLCRPDYVVALCRNASR